MRLRFAILAFCMIFFAGCASLKPTPELAKKMAGVYQGVLNIKGQDMPVATAFSVDDKAAITGKYQMLEATGAIEEGELYDIHAEGPYTLKASWKDKYGVGILRLLFSGDYLQFKGFWGITDHNMSMRWDGVRRQ